MAKGDKKKKKSSSYDDNLDFDGFDPDKQGSGYEGEQPKRGTYEGVLIAFNRHTSQGGNAGYRWIFHIDDDGPYDGWRGYVYSNMDAAKWKTQQIVYALTGSDKGVKLEPAEEGEDGTEAPLVKSASRVKLQVGREKNPETEESMGKIRSVLPLEGGKKKGKKSKKKSKAGAADPF